MKTRQRMIKNRHTLRQILRKIAKYCILTNRDLYLILTKRELRLLRKSRLAKTLLYEKYSRVTICGVTFLVKRRFNCRDIGPILTILLEELAKRHVLENTPNIELCREVECLYETILTEEPNTRDIVLALLRLILTRARPRLEPYKIQALASLAYTRLLERNQVSYKTRIS